MRIQTLGTVLAALCIAAVALPNKVRAQYDRQKYPIVFETGKEMERLGIALHGQGKDQEIGPNVSRFSNRCYYYGDGGNDISVSDEFLAKYRARGFSLNSLCLALQSPLAFHPETGERLPSYMVADIAKIKKYGSAVDAGVISEVLPLRVPDCFARGLPYHDCKFSYDISTGKKLTKAQLSEIEKGRRIFDQKMAEIKNNKAYTIDCRCEGEGEIQSDFSTQVGACRLEKIRRCPNNGDMSLIVGTLRAEGYLLYEVGRDGNAHPIFGESGITLVDISPNLPLGYGYQLMTDGAGAPVGGDEKIALDASRRATDAKVLAVLGDI